MLVSEGFSGHAAGVDRRQLPEKFRVRSVQGNVQGIYMTREITNAWALTRVRSCCHSVQLCTSFEAT